MLRVILAAVTILSVLAVSMGIGSNAPADGRAVSELEFAVQAADGERFQAHFLVAANHRDEAARAARAAIEQIHPGATVMQSDHDHDHDGGKRISRPW
ncbi:MAG: hypothetical protein U5Q44_13475 [Dehalococcoidia bacterium]|nr:hypothetical protein [Dehalococcoidia bacterium]